MWAQKPIYERVPLVWVLIGLLFIATGLYLGFEFTMSFVYMMVGGFCCALGVALFVFRLRERPSAPARTSLSPDFVSAGETRVMPDLSSSDPVTATEQSGTE